MSSMDRYKSGMPKPASCIKVSCPYCMQPNSITVEGDFVTVDFRSTCVHFRSSTLGIDSIPYLSVYFKNPYGKRKLPTAKSLYREIRELNSLSDNTLKEV